MRISTKSVQILLTEFIGSLLIVFITCWSYTVYKTKIIRLFDLGVINAFTIATFTWIALPYSGAHFNPVITVLKVCLQEMSGFNALMYIIVQLLGSFLGTLLAILIVPNTEKETNRFSIFYPTQNAEFTNFQSFLLEFIGAFLYILTYSATVLDRRAPSNVFGFATGSVFLLCVLCFGEITGACLNPIRVFGAHLINFDWSHSWLYWLAGSFGGLFAGFYYDFFLKKMSDHLDEIESVEIVENKNN